MKTLRLGSNGDEVLQLQNLLNCLNVDGSYFGSKTEEAVKAFQKGNGLTADGIVGAKTWAALLGEDVPADPSFKKPVDYKQYDSKWASVMYSNHNDKKQTIKSSGCGPTAMTDIVATMIDSKVTPVTLADLSMKWGCRTYDTGTAWSFFPKVADYYGFSKYKKATSLADLKACLDSGGYIVASMGKGYWTSGGHYICVWKYEGGYIYANDPASSKRTKQVEGDFMKQRKAFFCFWK